MKEPEIPENELHRIQSLRSYGILDSASDQKLDNITQLAAKITSSPISLITFIDTDRQWFKSTYGTVLRETPRKYSYCGHTINHKDRIMEVENAGQDERFIGNPFLEGEPYIRYYAGVKLFSKEGEALGTLCVMDSSTKKITEKEKELLVILADQVMLELEAWKNDLKSKLFFETYNDSNEAHAWFNKEGKLVHHNTQFKELIIGRENESNPSNLLEIINRDNNNRIINPEEKDLHGEPRIFTIYRNNRKLDIYTEYKCISLHGKPYLHVKSKELIIGNNSKEDIRTSILEHLQNVANIGYWELDLKTKKLYWSKIVKEIHEIEDDSQPSLSQALNFYKGKDKIKISKTVDEALKNGNSWNLKLS
ncbi:MAG: GAF domain-containing protein, partial [Nitrososphaeraceae archaeon]|nr:GAF domain-containing protein [Nitrososphaeraceae archaeon]